MNAEPARPRQHLLTVMLEDYFHAAAFKGLIQRGQWYRFETRFEQNTLKALDLLDRFGIKASFFVLGWVADKQPDIVREVARRGHEVASRGLYHRSTRRMTPAEFRDDLRRAREAVELATGTQVMGYRAARRWSSPADLWALDVLAEEGYAYDSSIIPMARAFSSESWRYSAHQHRAGERTIWEFPVSTYNLLGWRLPVAGGNYLRQFPQALSKHAFKRWHETSDAPFVMYTHVWELDPDQPRISGASPLARVRHYRNLDKMTAMLEEFFKTYNFSGIADYLQLTRTPVAGHDRSQLSAAATATATATAYDADPAFAIERRRLERRRPVRPVAPSTEPTTTGGAQHQPANSPTPVSIVVPCYNEELILPYLANTLRSVQTALRDDYDLRFIFVDDCSSDRTADSLRRMFGAWTNCTFIRHPRNVGVAAAILNGVRHADTEIVCSIDCDCTYDPHELRAMIPLLAADVDMVTASPYHPQGGVRNVPGWRLSLSMAASFLYRQTLRQKLFTYTSCFRVYRRSAVVDLRLWETSFLGVAETLGKLDLHGSKIVEHPATLEVRLFGRSKMKVLRTIAGHLRLLARLAAMRVRLEHGAAGELLAEETHAPAAAPREIPLGSGYQAPPIIPQK